MKNNIEIKWADNEEERLGVNQDSDHKLFIGSLPKTCTEIIPQKKNDVPQVNWQKIYFKYYTEDNIGYYYHPYTNSSSFDKPQAGSLINDIDGSTEFIEANPIQQLLMQKNEVFVINDRKDVYDGKKHGPPGSNLFIFHLPTDFRDSDLERLFGQFGEVISARVNTRPDGTSKGFGFISYNSAKEAEDAINNLNGFQLKNKRLKVEIKKEQNTLHSSSFQNNFNPF
ncbi:hypothetical protein IMG5_148660 [Ichthyophthirius multifiliis]|uniref:RRM domain-containing protein n=1 Tax=Ichthyophthirius multifiliis TaxID=5932 RepID=G0QYC2_ICHMU|nr:hypothetical protein IMG5_148660 [Ichthyophthirius multifiliis]EGR29785.1 hypothetical protein IMG5_148660 [Ichthyophthirius multifiliis]|eukprot:XP_004031021.1 hypothetical protein IMG5_148660 [Ichthyophthirius multifiliis]